MCNSSISLFKVLTYFPLNIIRKAIHLLNVIWTVYSYSFPLMWTICGVYKIFSYESRAPLRISIIMCVYGNSTMKVNYFVFIPGIRFILTGTWNTLGTTYSYYIVIFIKMLFIFVVVVFCYVYTYFYFPCNLIQAYVYDYEF